MLTVALQADIFLCQSYLADFLFKFVHFQKTNVDVFSEQNFTSSPSINLPLFFVFGFWLLLLATFELTKLILTCRLNELTHHLLSHWSRKCRFDQWSASSCLQLVSWPKITDEYLFRGFLWWTFNHIYWRSILLCRKWHSKSFHPGKQLILKLLYSDQRFY